MSKPQSCIDNDAIKIKEPKSHSAMEIFKQFLRNSIVSLTGDNHPPTPIEILRDTRTSQFFILAELSHGVVGKSFAAGTVDGSRSVSSNYAYDYS